MEFKKENIFNGNYLTYRITQELYTKIVKLIGKNEFQLYNDQHNILICLPFKKMILPIGLFSNDNFNLDVKDESYNKEFIFEMSSTIESKIQLKEIQEKILNLFIKEYDKIYKKNIPPYINLVVQCSVGKTIMALYIITNMIKLKTFIITKSLELAKQWAAEINKFLKIDYYVSLQGSNHFLKNIKNKNIDILIFPSKHLKNQNFIKYLSNNFSFGVIDEQHENNMENDNYLKHFMSFNTFAGFLSLTATPRKINRLYFGKEINTDNLIQRFLPKKFKQEMYEINLAEYNPFVKSNYLAEYTRLKNNNVDKQKTLLKYVYKNYCIAEDINRINTIVETIIQTFNHNQTLKYPKIIILTQFLFEIDLYYNKLIEKEITSHFVFKTFPKKTFYLAEVKERIKTLNTYIIIGTEQYLGTGIDIVNLNILHMTNLSKDEKKIIQYAGRVSRDNEDQTHFIYFYNINSYKKLGITIDPEITLIKKKLKEKNWNYNFKMV